MLWGGDDDDDDGDGDDGVGAGDDGGDESDGHVMWQTAAELQTTLDYCNAVQSRADDMFYSAQRERTDINRQLDNVQAQLDGLQ